MRFKMKCGEALENDHQLGVGHFALDQVKEELPVLSKIHITNSPTWQGF